MGADAALTPSPWRGLLDAAVLFFATLAFAVVASAIWDPRAGRSELLWHLLAQHLLVVIGVTLVLARRAGLTVRTRIGTTRAPVLWAVAALAGTLAVILLQSPLVEAWAERIGFAPPEWWQRAVVLWPLPEAILTGVALALVPALSEELFFRGLLLRRLAGLGALAAVLLQAAVFAAYHLDAFALPIYFASGLLLGGLRLWSGALWPCVVAHLGNNLAGVVEIDVGATAWDQLGTSALPLGLGMAVLAVVVGRAALLRTRRR